MGTLWLGDGGGHLDVDGGIQVAPPAVALLQPPAFQAQLATGAGAGWHGQASGGAQLGGSHVSYEVIDLPDGRFDQRKAMMEALAKIVTTAFEKTGR